MNIASASGLWRRLLYGAAGFLFVMLNAVAQQRTETDERIFIAAANMEDAIVVDCQLPGKLRKLGGTRTYLTPGRVVRRSAVECRTRGGEYTLGDLASGTLSLARWLDPANEGDPEAQYYVARIYANGMDNVPVDYRQAAVWYQRAADQGYSEAKQELGYLYEQGLGVEKDPLLALNLQRDASGLGEELDYAWKVAEAEALQAELAAQLEAANDSLQRSRLELRNTQQQLAGARGEVRRREAEMAGIIAELRQAESRAENAAPERVDTLERALEDAKVQLADSQTRILELERERDGAVAELKAELIGGQAASLELRELLAVSRSEADTLRAELANEQQRLIQSEEELRALRDQYREESEQLAAENERLLAARSRSESDAAALLAAREANIASQNARIASLEAELQRLRQRVASMSSQEPALQQELAATQKRYEAELAKLRAERDNLQASDSRSREELDAMAAETRKRLQEKEAALEARRREIDSLRAASDALRGRVAELETRQQQQAEAAGAATGRLQAELSEARKEVIELRDALETMQAEKSDLQAKLSKQRLELQKELQRAEADRQKVALLEAEIAASESTINAQNLRISGLESRIRESDVELARLRDDRERGASEAMSEEVRNAMAVLEMARSTPGSYHALLIANEEYQHLPPLSTPVRDVNVIRQLLTERYDFNVELLENATEDEIMKALHQYANDLTEGDSLLIYYAGRGSTPDGPPDRAYWLGVDSDPELPNTWLLAEHVSEKIKQIPAKHVLVVTDSCFSKRRTGSNAFSVGRGLNPKRFGILANLPARLVLTSGANTPVTNSDGDQQHSLFATYFIEVLRQNRNVLSGEMLSHEMIFRVRDNVRDPERATPTYQPLLGAGHGHGDFFFVPSMEATLVAASGGP